jgi:hypothetical protein
VLWSSAGVWRPSGCANPANLRKDDLREAMEADYRLFLLVSSTWPSMFSPSLCVQRRLPVQWESVPAGEKPDLGSLHGRVEGNRPAEAHGQSQRRDGERVPSSQGISSGMSSVRSDVIVDVVISSSSVLLAGSYISTTAITSTGPANQRNYRNNPQ